MLGRVGFRRRSEAVDPVITPIVTAIAVGAVAGLRDSATQAVRDAYGAVRSLLNATYPSIELKQIEEKPTSQPRRESLAEDLVEAGAGEDRDLLRLVRALVEAVRRDDPGAGATARVDLEDVEARVMAIRDVTSSGGNAEVRVTGARVEEDLMIEGVHAGNGGPYPNV
jgi:hypothetical protein